MKDEPESKYPKTPQGNFFEKAVDLATSFDRLMVTIYSALIAGVALLLLTKELSLWVGAPLFLSLVCFALGIGHTLIHLSFTGKMLLALEALRCDIACLPNFFDDEEPAEDAYARSQAYAQHSYVSQLVYLILGVGFTALGIIVRLWEYAWRGGVILLCIFAVIFSIGALTNGWKRCLRRFRPSAMAD